jgi:hypothetical protein
LGFSRFGPLFRFAFTHQIRFNQLPANTLSLPDQITAKWKSGLNLRDNQQPLFEPVTEAMARAPKHDAATLCANSQGMSLTL